MIPRSASAVDAACRLWRRAVGDTTAPDEFAAAANHMCAQLRVNLGRWIGAEGYRVLLARAHDEALAEHRALRGLACLGGDEPVIAAAVRENGAGAVAAGLVTMATVLTALLARIVGEAMASRLVEQTSTSSPRGIAGMGANGGRDGEAAT